MKHFEQIMFNQISNLILRRTSCWNNITNKHYWPKTGRSSQKQKMYEKQSSKTKLIQKQITKFPTKRYQWTSWTDNVQPNIKLNINTNWEELPAENMTNQILLTQNRQIKSKTEHVPKVILKTKLIHKQITKFPTKWYQWNILNR